MKKVLRDKWVKALRSGKYKQTGDVLFDRHANSYCCLGVLCKVSGTKIPSGASHLGVRGLRTLERDAGLGKMEGGEQQRILADMNDKGDSFKDIAKWIVKNVKVQP